MVCAVIFRGISMSLAGVADESLNLARKARLLKQQRIRLKIPLKLLLVAKMVNPLMSLLPIVAI